MGHLPLQYPGQDPRQSIHQALATFVAHLGSMLASVVKNALAVWTASVLLVRAVLRLCPVLSDGTWATSRSASETAICSASLRFCH